MGVIVQHPKLVPERSASKLLRDFSRNLRARLLFSSALTNNSIGSVHASDVRFGASQQAAAAFSASGRWAWPGGSRSRHPPPPSPCFCMPVAV